MGARPWKTYSTSVLGTFKHGKSAFVEVKRNVVLKYTSLDCQKRVEKNPGLRHHGASNNGLINAKAGRHFQHQFLKSCCSCTVSFTLAL